MEAETSERRFSKHVDIVAKSDEDRTATGVVLTPWELDHQLDFAQPEGIESMYNPDPDDGVMHSAFPSGHSTLERNEILATDEAIDGEQFEAGEWVIRRKYHNERRWNLVKSGVLSSFSIGGDVTAREYESIDDLPDDVHIPDEVTPESVPDRYWPPSEMVGGEVKEISDVDMGAVVSADMAVVKSDGKAIPDEAGDPDTFVELMQARNPDASEDDLRDLWAYMEGARKAADAEKQELDPEVADCKDSVLEDNPGMSEGEAIAICRDQLGKDSGATDDMTEHNDSDGDPEPGATSKASGSDIEEMDDATIGQRFKEWLRSGFGGESTASDERAESRGGAEQPSEEQTESSEKVGRTLNSRMVDRFKAEHDIAEQALDEAGINPHSPTTRTYDEDYNDKFELSQFGDVTKVENNSIMTAEEIERLESLEERLDDLEKAVDEEPDDDEAAEKDARIEELEERLEDLEAEKAEADDAEESEKDARIEELEERVDKLSSATAESQQLEGGNVSGDWERKKQLAELESEVFG